MKISTELDLFTEKKPRESVLKKTVGVKNKCKIRMICHVQREIFEKIERNLRCILSQCDNDI